ncbi:Zn-dependent dipeptidase, microsomal dipeptidase-like protein [Hoeflea phototrophica DFL-43]|uniref:Zn-dependent dipeptidase, microsomal dipeptidase-like protein n=1 Tax=Hoeflea phototrophica (strain DSM 17068 / NCIMB 14078 / DFL-43) TaxID=411684 RepID=A9CXX9_HOEPD|nr:dipeptidase [Hoeflea phototrophica]EDQ35741.2 Zn-dependent dipeptidase, microsomal dipeptidase-like protein [Hoeflea phototrophica DFL-43]
MADTPFFDGHNDFLLRLRGAPDQRKTLWLEQGTEGHLDLPRMQQAGFAGGFFAIYIPSPHDENASDYQAMMDNPPYDLPLPALMNASEAQSTALKMAGHLMWMERASKGALRICRSSADLRACMADGTIAAIMHMEGAEAIGPDLDALYAFHAMGLRSLGPVWSRPTVFGHGVPFRFPGDPDTGPGLTEAGKDLVRACNELKIMIDLSHLNEKGFNDVASLTDAPLVATHSNAHAVTRSTRNLTDRQLAMIRESGGMVGLNYATVFLREDGRKSTDCGWDPVMRHLDHLVEKLGEDHVGFGSDFDGADLPDVIGDVTGVQVLIEQMRKHQYGEELIEKIACKNWTSLLERTWGE